MERGQFTFYRSYYDALSMLPAKSRERILMAIISYALDGVEQQLSGVESAVFLLVKPTLDSGRKRAESGKQGGSKPKANAKQTVTEKEKEKEKEKEIEIEKEKENDSSPKPSPKESPTRHKYGSYQNVLLTDEDFQKLKSEFPDWEIRVERLSEYIASTGKSYKSHLATIRSWARKDAPKQEGGFFAGKLDASEMHRYAADIRRER